MGVLLRAPVLAADRAADVVVVPRWSRSRGKVASRGDRARDLGRVIGSVTRLRLALSGTTVVGRFAGSRRMAGPARRCLLRRIHPGRDRCHRRGVRQPDLTVRARRAGCRRAQVKWFLYRAGATFVLNIVGDLVARSPRCVWWPHGVQVFIVVAIERYRLWEIDRLINRTVVYGTVTLIAAALYVSAAISIGLVVGGAGARSGFAVAGATLLIAVLFARRRDDAAPGRGGPANRPPEIRRSGVCSTNSPIASGTTRLYAELEDLLADVLRDPDLVLCFVTATGTVIDGAGAELPCRTRTTTAQSPDR